MKFSNYKIFWFFFAIIFIVLIIFAHNYGILDPAENGISYVTKPIQVTFHEIGNKFYNFFNIFFSLNKLQSKNSELEEEVKKLNAEVASLQELKVENKALRDQLGFSQKTDYQTVAAEIISHEPESLLQYFMINKGKSDGIDKNMIVLSSGLLVGKVSDVYDKQAKVVLITNPTSSTAVMTENSRANGIVKGGIEYPLVMEMIPQNEVISPGDRIVTSGYGGDYPKGLLLGTVENVESKPTDLFQKAVIKPLIDFSRLEIVFVVLNK